MKHFLLGAAMLMTLAACTNKEQSDYEKVMESTDMMLLRTYLESYKDAPIEHTSAVKQRLADLEVDSTFYAEFLSVRDDVADRYSMAQHYVEDLPNGLHIDEMKAIIAKDSAEAEKIFAEREAALAAQIKAQEAETNFGTIRERIRNAIFVRNKYDMVFLTVPDDEGKGYGMEAGGLESSSFSYTAKPESNELIANFTHSDQLFTISVFRDCIYISGMGKDIYYQKNPLSESDYKDTEKKLKEQIKKGKKDHKD